MKSVFVFVFLCIIVSQVQGQSYQAKNAMRTRVIPVPDAAARKFKKDYPKAIIDSCYVYGTDENPEREFMFYSKQDNLVLNASYDNKGKRIELKQEISIERLPKTTQQIISKNDVHAKGVGKFYKEVTWFSKEIRANRRKKRLKEILVEYMVEFSADYNGKEFKVPMYFTESGYQANPGFR